MIPVFVPSYKRPKATFLRRSLLYNFEMYVFVRKEEELDYSWLKNRPNTQLVLLNKVSNIGETRRAMVRYAQSKGIERIFMIDDDVTRLDFSVWEGDRKYCRASGTIQGSPENMDKVLDKWEELWVDEVLCSPLYRRFAISNQKAEDIYKKRNNQVQQAVGVDVAFLKKHGINYQSNDIVGNEDLFLQYEVIGFGGETKVFNLLQYDAPARGKGSGGCQDMYDTQTQSERLKLFMSMCDHKDFVRVGESHSGIKSIKFNWRNIR